MAVTENGNGLSAADVAAVMGGNNGFNGVNWGDGSFWIIVLFIFALMGNGFGNGFGNGAGAMPLIMNNGNDVQRGFDQQAIMGGISGLSTAVTNGFANAEVSRCNSQANILQTLNANQNATIAGMNSLAMNLQQGSCDNRAGLADLKYTIATEACADRQAVSDALRDVIASNTANTQAILDKMCQQEIEALKTQNANLQTQLNMAALAASQGAQTSRILADNAAQTQALEQYLNPSPIPAYVVQNPNCCQPFAGCGCGA
jgi:hypothetical protein